MPHKNNAVYRALAPRAGFAGQAWHLQFTPFALSQAVSGAWSLLLLGFGGPQSVRAVVAMALALKIAGGGVLVAAIVARFFPILANERGLRARNFWGLAREVKWDEITQVTPIRWLIFTHFARISTANCRNIVWLPLFLCDQNEFERAVRCWAASDNPLRHFLENRFHAQSGTNAVK